MKIVLIFMVMLLYIGVSRGNESMLLDGSPSDQRIMQIIDVAVKSNKQLENARIRLGISDLLDQSEKIATLPQIGIGVGQSRSNTNYEMSSFLPSGEIEKVQARWIADVTPIQFTLSQVLPTDGRLEIAYSPQYIHERGKEVAQRFWTDPNYSITYSQPFYLSSRPIRFGTNTYERQLTQAKKRIAEIEYIENENSIIIELVENIIELDRNIREYQINKQIVYITNEKCRIANINNQSFSPTDIEGFRVGGHGLYQRVIVPTKNKRLIAPAWIYHMPTPQFSVRIASGKWNRLTA